jgi:hypothetical protein
MTALRCTVKLLAQLGDDQRRGGGVQHIIASPVLRHSRTRRDIDGRFMCMTPEAELLLQLVRDESGRSRLTHCLRLAGESREIGALHMTVALPTGEHCSLVLHENVQVSDKRPRIGHCC